MDWSQMKSEIPITFCPNFIVGETSPVKTFLLPSMGRSTRAVLY